jgi:hypothetical protein
VSVRLPTKRPATSVKALRFPGTDTVASFQFPWKLLSKPRAGEALSLKHITESFPSRQTHSSGWPIVHKFVDG